MVGKSMHLLAFDADRAELFAGSLYGGNKERGILRSFAWLQKARIAVYIPNIDRDAISQNLSGSTAAYVHLHVGDGLFVLQRSRYCLRNQRLIILIDQVDHGLVGL